jgi:hypothetical protein
MQIYIFYNSVYIIMNTLNMIYNYPAHEKSLNAIYSGLILFVLILSINSKHIL